ncbi:S26 family signal peptidase [Nonomuraea gerenzanensis]|uniref:S26 family signal peptidase n=1 Tax=Nonomuraea gerenzanensis TaxID=93944 RepID=UPI001CD9B0C9|nr:S26 family signal peptidase [Nonomuraea gerenzanensis]UBU18342.1 S26 family signal peptidase [Nonomuraea gerenzanensis]
MWYALIALAVLVVLAVVARRGLVVVQVSGVSMAPAYRPGDRVLVRRTGAVRRGRVVVFESTRPSGWGTGPPAPPWAIKRVTALPGDPVPADVVEAVAAGPGARVPEGALVVVGDGTSSADSRVYGYVPADRVLGVVVRKLSSGASEGVP